MCTLHAGKDPRLPSALLGERCVQNLNQVEFQDAKLFLMLLCLNFIFLMEGQSFWIVL